MVHEFLKTEEDLMNIITSALQILETLRSGNSSICWKLLIAVRGTCQQ
jgi:hypothetical protein